MNDMEADLRTNHGLMQLYTMAEQRVRELLAVKPGASVEEIIVATLTCTFVDAKRRLVMRHVADAKGEPRCALCGHRIFLDVEDSNAADFLTLDHIRPECEGGQLSYENTQPTHRLCNNVREVYDRGRVPKKRTLTKLHAMYEELKARECTGSSTVEHPPVERKVTGSTPVQCAIG